MSVKHGSNTRVIFDRYSLSCDMNEVTWSVDRPTADVTAFCDDAKKFVPGQQAWKADVKGWHDSRGSVNTAGSVDGTVGSDVALWYLQNQGTAPVKTDKVFGYFPEGYGTGKQGYAGVGGVLNSARTANLGGGVGITSTFAGTSPFTKTYVLWGGTINTTAGTGLGVNIGSPPQSVGGQNGAYCYFWIIGTVGGNGTAQVVGTVRAADTLGGVYTDIARFSGTAAGAYAIQATVTAGSVPQYMNFAYRTSDVAGDTAAGTAQGTIIAAVGLIPPLSS